MSYVLGKTSLSRLEGVHPDLVKVVKKAIKITKQDFSVLEGLRTRYRQRYLFNKGKSKTMNSRHLTGHAVDLGPYPWGADLDEDGIHNGADWDNYYPIVDAIIEVAKGLDIPIRWGGNWRVNDIRSWDKGSKALNKAYSGTFSDGPHLEIPRGYGFG